jgi:hypothetical protein
VIIPRDGNGSDAADDPEALGRGRHQHQPQAASATPVAQEISVLCFQNDSIEYFEDLEDAHDLLKAVCTNQNRYTNDIVNTWTV